MKTERKLVGYDLSTLFFIIVCSTSFFFLSEMIWREQTQMKQQKEIQSQIFSSLFLSSFFFAQALLDRFSNKDEAYNLQSLKNAPEMKPKEVSGKFSLSFSLSLSLSIYLSIHFSPSPEASQSEREFLNILSQYGMADHGKSPPCTL